MSEEKETSQKSRIEAFSDGVFAIAITLLVLDLIEILHSRQEETIMKTAMMHWESFLGFTIGFVTILVCWINHHVALEYVRKIDIRFIWINGFLLFVVTLTPFSSAILAGYLDNQSTTALSVFGFNYVLISIAADALCTYAYNHQLIDEMHKAYYATYKKIYRFAVFYTILVFLLCFISVIIPIILYALLFSLFAAPKEFASKLYRMRLKRENKKQPSGIID